jgi:hypothetical protein
MSTIDSHKQFCHSVDDIKDKTKDWIDNRLPELKKMLVLNSIDYRDIILDVVQVYGFDSIDCTVGDIEDIAKKVAIIAHNNAIDFCKIVAERNKTTFHEGTTIPNFDNIVDELEQLKIKE